MQHLYGGPAFTPFQLDKLHASSGVRALESAELFLLDTDGLSAKDEARLSTLLATAPAPQERAPDWVLIPRLGTISPWSSKATEILAASGIDAVRRVERGVALWVDGDDTDLGAAVCDPMTQALVSTIAETAALFDAVSYTHLTLPTKA